MSDETILNAEVKSILRDIFRRINPCPRCRSDDRHLESRFSVSRDRHGFFYITTVLSIICDDCGYVYAFRKSEPLPERLAGIFERIFAAKGDA